MRRPAGRGIRNGAITRGRAIIAASSGDITAGHLIAEGLSRQQAHNALGQARRQLKLIRRVARGVYRRVA